MKTPSRQAENKARVLLALNGLTLERRQNRWYRLENNLLLPGMIYDFDSCTRAVQFFREFPHPPITL